MQIGTIRVGRVGLLVLGTALLLPGSGFGQTPDARIKLMDYFAQQQPPAAPVPDKDKIQLEIKKMEATLEKKRKEVEEAQAQIKALSLKLKDAENANKGPATITGVQLPITMLWQLAGEQVQSVEEIHLRKVGDKWEVIPTKPLGEQLRISTVLPPASQPPIHMDGQPMLVPPLVAPAPPLVAPAPPATAPGTRIDELEKKIDRALQQLEQMRRDLKGGRTGGALPPGGAPEGDTIRSRVESKPER
jgi:hypothetical protein